MFTRDAVIVDAVRTPVGRRNGSLAAAHAVDLSAHVLRALAERTGIAPALVDDGVENMSAIPMGAPVRDADLGSPASPLVERRYGVPFNQGIGAEMMADKWGFSRTELDEFAARSHERLAAAIDGGRFAAQLAAVPLPGGGTFEVDEGLRRGTDVATLRPAFEVDGRIHAGNSSQISDGAAALLMMTSQMAAELGLAPVARVHTAVLAGDDPVTMLGAPIPATHKALAKAGLTIDQIGAFEVNEAFAPVPLAWLAETGVDAARLNANGGAIAVGHPLGASGARLMTTLVHHMRDNGIAYGLQTMCEGGGMANATVLELLAR